MRYVDILSQCIYSVKNGGNVSIIADYVGFTNHFPIGAMMEKQMMIRGGQSYTQKHWDTVMSYIQDGSFNPYLCVTHECTMEDLPPIYENMHLKNDGIIKQFIRLN